MNDPRRATRRGSIGDDIAALDLVAFNGGHNPFNNPFMDEAFALGAQYYRGVVDRWYMRGFDRVADIGSGYGRWSLFLAEVNAHVVGFERNADAVSLSRKLAAHFDLPDAAFEVADVTDLDVADGTFDAAWCYNALHLIDRGKLLREAARILAPGGTLMVGWYNGAGRVIEKLLAGYAAGGVTNRVAQFALRVLSQGPLENAGATYGSPEHIAVIFDRFGFDLDSVRPHEVERSGAAHVPDELAALVDDLPAFAERFQNDARFAARIAQTPEIATLLPANLHFAVTKR